MLDEGNEREELNLDMAFAPRTQPEKERYARREQSGKVQRTGRAKSETVYYVRRVTTVQAKKNSREKRKQAEQEYRARRERSEDKYNIDGMRFERQHRAGKVQSENEQYTKTGHRRAHREKPGKRFLRLLFAEVFFVLLAAVLIISVIRLLSDGKLRRL